MAEKFIELGHTVLACGRSREVIETLRKTYRPPHDFSAVDVAQESKVEPWAARLLSTHGAPDLLINNAAIINQSAPLWQVPGDEFDRLIDINIKGVANVIRYFVPAMVAHKAGVIINFSSGWGRSVAADVAPYCASKWAIEGLTLALAHGTAPAHVGRCPSIPASSTPTCFAAASAATPAAIPRRRSGPRKRCPICCRSIRAITASPLRCRRERRRLRHSAYPALRRKRHVLFNPFWAAA